MISPSIVIKKNLLLIDSILIRLGPIIRIITTKLVIAMGFIKIKKDRNKLLQSDRIYQILIKIIL